VIDLISDCVHCGFCLQACPTYQSWGNEADSPRGRIDLMRGVVEGTLALDAQVVPHFDRCLGCMACMTACPSGVKYDELIETTRAQVETQYRRPLHERIFRAMIFALFPYPKRLRAIAPLLNLVARTPLRRLAPGGSLLREIDVRAASAPLAPVYPAKGDRRARVGFVTGCVQRVFFPQVNAATIRVLTAEGCEVVIPPQAGCCGALSLHSGRREEALAFARKTIEAFDALNLDAIITNAAGCGSAMKEYGELLADDPAWAQRAAAFSAKVKDVTEFLAPLEPRAPRAPRNERIAYHDACHLAHAQRIRSEPRELLCSIPGVTLVEIPQGDQCCGSAGTYNLFEPESAREIGLRKVENLLKTDTRIVASANPGCTLQMQSLLREHGIELQFLHPIEILDQSLSS
jgi:glycolate oxidase iron-sulfur subunit